MHLKQLLISRELFSDIKSGKLKPKNNIERASHYLYILTQSFGAKQDSFGMNAKGFTSPPNIYKSYQKWSKRLRGVTIENKSFEDLITTYDNDEAFFYCDPPYAGTTGYKTKFDSGSFWEWAEKSAKVADVYVSEYNAPQGWECIWEKETGSLAGKASVGKRATEKLFRLNKQEMAL